MDNNPQTYLQQFQAKIAAITAFFDRIGFVWFWLLVSILLLLLVLPLNPAKGGSYLWFMSKLCGAAALGYAFDSAFFPGSDPRYQEGIEKSMAQSRRGLLIVGAMIAAGLIG